jgi:hypothetical protein
MINLYALDSYQGVGRSSFIASFCTFHRNSSNGIYAYIVLAAESVAHTEPDLRHVFGLSECTRI